MSEKKKITDLWKNTNTDIKFLILILVGFMIVVFDQHIDCHWLSGIYPPYQQAYKDMNDEFQLYTLNYIFGMHANIYEYSIGEITYRLKVDIFSDLIGYLLMAIGLFRLSHKTKIFSISGMTAMLAAALYIVTRLLPFVFNGAQLTYICFFLIIAQYGLEVCIGYMFIYGIFDLLAGYQYSRDRRAIGLSWFSTIIVNLVLIIIGWMSMMLNPVLITFYNMLDLALNLMFVYFVYKNREYILGLKKA